MMAKSSTHKLVEYYSKPLSFDRINYLNGLNAVETEKVVLYRDFIISLIYLVNDTFLGDDVMTEEVHFKNHFKWCWKKNISNFTAESLVFDETGEHYYYFEKYFNDVFYGRKEKPKTLVKMLITFWVDIMNMERVKTHSEYDLFINLYKIKTKHFRNNFS